MEEAEHTRETGKGRRPNAMLVRSLKKRAGLARQSYEVARRSLEAMAAGRPQAPDWFDSVPAREKETGA
jgi:hypothetical protein